MAKKKYIDYKKQQQELFNRTEGYAFEVRKIYQECFTKIINLVKGTELSDGVPFSFSEYGYSEEVTPILRNMYSRVYQTIRGGVEKEWEFSNKSNDELVKGVFGENSVEDNHFAKLFQRNQEAMNAFFSRVSQHGGMNLSQKVWNYTGQFKEELEKTLDLAIGEGTPAKSLAAKIQGYLNEPDRYYRRFRIKIGEDENGNPIYGRKWKRRTWDKESQSYKWIDANPKDYKPGRGVYRSSSKNAQRLARTETNIAYRTADYTRWQQLEFVIGVEIKLSNNHPCVDICDDLKGIYPKSFKWTGWHPNCRCYMVPVLAKDTDMDKMLDEILNGEDPGNVKCDNEVKELPGEFKTWMSDNQDRIQDAKERGTLPYFLMDNKRLVGLEKPTAQDIAKERHAARTEQEVEAIKKAWWERKAVYHYGQNIINVMGSIPDVDTSALVDVLKRSNLDDIMAEANKLKAIGKEIYSYDLLDDPMFVARKFGYEDTKAVFNAVKQKYQSWADKFGASDWDSITDLEYKAKKLNYEIQWLAQNHFGKVWEKTWEVSQQAYIKELAKVNEAKAWKVIKDSMSELMAYNQKTKSSQFKGFYNDLVEATLNGDLKAAQMAYNNAQQKKLSLEAAANKRAAKKYGSGDISFGDECFTKKRKDDAKYFRDEHSANDYFFDSAVDDWALASADERTAMHRYTVGSAYITEPLRAVKGYYHYYTSRIEQFEKDCKAMTSFLDRCHLRDDAWIKRDDNSSIFGSDWKLNLWDFVNDPSALVGKETKVETFLSCGSNRGTRFTGTGVTKDVIYNIYAPKGTKATYAEPYNNYGQYDGGWDGKKKPTSLNENEIILQRGTKFRITKAEYKNGMWYIDVDVIAQAPTEILEIVTESSGFYCKFKR